MATALALRDCGYYACVAGVCSMCMLLTGSVCSVLQAFSLSPMCINTMHDPEW